MPKKILLIENDSALAASLSESLEAGGFEVRVTGDGQEGLDLARADRPDAIVLCVELPRMSGYSICQRLKKDDALLAIPLVLTSAEATAETFDQHRKLKVAAQEYLLKPFAAAALVEKLRGLLPSEDGALGADEELVRLDEDVEVAALAADDVGDDLPVLDLEAIPDEPSSSGELPPEDDALQLLDDAFDGIAAPPEEPGHEAVAAIELAAGPAHRDDDLRALADLDEAPPTPRAGGLEDADLALDALGAGDGDRLDEGLSLDIEVPAPAPAAPAPAVRGANADLLRAAGIRLLEDDAPRAPAVPGRRPAERESPFAAAAGRENDAELAALKAKLEALTDRLERAEAERDDARRAADGAEAELADARRRADEAEAEARRAAGDAEAASRVETLERELDELRNELVVARGEADGARGEVERRTAELQKRFADLEATNAKNEERVVKAYQKIKADEKVRDKVRKALAIATQLLDEGLAPETGAEKRVAAILGRETT